MSPRTYLALVIYSLHTLIYLPGKMRKKRTCQCRRSKGLTYHGYHLVLRPICSPVIRILSASMFVLCVAGREIRRTRRRQKNSSNISHSNSILLRADIHINVNENVRPSAMIGRLLFQEVEIP